MNWVLIICGLIPFWTALLVILMNRGAAKQPRRTFKELPDYETDYVSDYGYEEPPQPPSPRLGFLKRINLGFLSRLRGRLPWRKKVETREPRAAPRGEAESSRGRPERVGVVLDRVGVRREGQDGWA